MHMVIPLQEGVDLVGSLITPLAKIAAARNPALPHRLISQRLQLTILLIELLQR